MFVKSFIKLNLLFALLIPVGCQQAPTKSEQKPITKKKAEFKREIFDVEKYSGLLAIGKLEIEKSWCAATLVAADIAVTAGHCFIAQEVDLFKNKERLSKITNVVFKSKEGSVIPNVSVSEILRYRIDPDFAIVRLNKRIPAEVIKPLKISDMKFTDMLANPEKLGCAGYNGDKELGNRGKNLTISRNIKVYYKESNSKKIDTNCVSTNGGSGGLFFEETYNEETKTKEHYFLGIIWGVTGDNYDAKGNLINERETVTSITPVKVFRKELDKIIQDNKSKMEAKLWQK